MNRRMYGMFSTIPVEQVYSMEMPKLGGRKKSAVQATPVGCAKCGLGRVTLRKTEQGLLCPKCYERRNAK